MVIEELMRVVEQRKQRTERSIGVRRMVKEAYVPLHRELFNNSGDINLVKKKPTKIKDDIYILPLFTESTCEQILEEANKDKRRHIHPSSLHRIHLR